jgi:DNA-binding GntR family transcriptional regulator
LENAVFIETFSRWVSRVITLDRETIRDRYMLREAVECQVVRILATQIEFDQAEQLTRMAEQLDVLVANEPVPDSFWELDHEFHLTMARFTESKSLHKALGHINLFRLLQKTREQVILSHIELPEDLHRSLVKAILSKDPDTAERQMRNHINVSTKSWLYNP